MDSPPAERPGASVYARAAEQGDEADEVRDGNVGAALAAYLRVLRTARDPAEATHVAVTEDVLLFRSLIGGLLACWMGFVLIVVPLNQLMYGWDWKTNGTGAVALVVF